MSLSILQQPGTVSFAGDPILVKAQTTQTGRTFLQVRVTVEVNVYVGSVVGTYSDEYSYPVGSDGIATLDVSKTVQSAIRRHTLFSVSGTTISQETCKALFTLTVQETYLDGTTELTGDTWSSAANDISYLAIPGALTEYERLVSASQDTATLLGSARILSRKPQGEEVPLGSVLYVPAIAGSTGPSNPLYITATQGSDHAEFYDYPAAGWIPLGVSVETADLALGGVSLQLSGDTAEHAVAKHIVPATPLMRHFLFLNGFGLPESVTATVCEALSYEVENQLYNVPGEVSFRPNTTVLSYTDAPQAVYQMSSGFVSREWAEWWTTEFLPTRQAWMLSDDGTRYLPVAIVPTGDTAIYDRSKPGLMAVPFEVRPSFRGSGLNRFV